LATSILFNGVSYTIPATADESWGANLTAFLIAIPQGALQKTGGNFTLTSDLNLGANFGLFSKHFSSRTVSPSTAGIIRLSVSDSIGWRNTANSGNLLLSVNGSDQLTFNGVAIYGAGITALTGDVTASGPGSAAVTVNSVGGSSASLIHSAELLSNASTDLNTASTIVKRDVSGNFSAGTITATLNGNASTATTASTATSATTAGTATTITTTLPIASGGTGQTTANAAFNALSPMTTGGDLIYGGTSGAATRLPNGTSGQVLFSNGGTAAPSWGSSVSALSPLTTKGDLFGYSTTNARIPRGSNGQVLMVDNNADLGLRYHDQSDRNLILNDDAEADLTGWSTYGGGASNTPLASGATGGSPTCTWTRATIVSNGVSIKGSASFLFTRDANNRQGEGVAYQFSTRQCDNARELDIAFDYNIFSGTFFPADGVTAPLVDGSTSQNAGMSDLEVFVYDVTNNALIPVTPNVLTATPNTTTTASFKGKFKTVNSSNSYRLCLHVARTTAVAFAAMFDNFYVGRLRPNLTTPTVQKFTSGSGTYTTPTGALYLRVRMVGGGGGGQGSSGNGASNGGNAGNATDSTFGTSLLVAGGGSGGGNGSTGGTYSLGTGPVGLGFRGAYGGFGQPQGSISGSPIGVALSGGMGGNSVFGGAGSSPNGGNNGTAAFANTGSGGGGAANDLVANALSGAGGGAGAYVDVIIKNPLSSYSYTVGAGTAGGTAGTSGFAGGAGADGIIIVEEFYQ